jgi:cytochrome c-type biogenesis protein CcmH/NrfF
MTVGNCPMIGCGSADPMRRRIYDMQARGITDDAIVKQVVQEQGIVALSGQQPLPWIAWLMPGIALILGFGVYTAYVRRNRRQPIPPSASDEATLDRYRAQIDRELDESGDTRGR